MYAFLNWFSTRIVKDYYAATNGTSIFFITLRVVRQLLLLLWNMPLLQYKITYMYMCSHVSTLRHSRRVNRNKLTVRITGNIHAFYGIVSTRKDKTRDRFSRNECFIVDSNDTITSQGNFFCRRWRCIVCLGPVHRTDFVLPHSHVSILNSQRSLDFRLIKVKHLNQIFLNFYL